MSRAVVLAYGLICYAVFFAVFLYSVGFVADLWVPRTIDAGAPDGGTPGLLLDVALLGVFGIQHSVMARRGFKAWWQRVVPAAIERSTYVLFSSAALALVYWQWRPAGAVVWQTSGVVAVALSALGWLGWAVVLASSFMISHFDLFGLRQVWLHAKGRPYRDLAFTTRGFYAFVRHPLQTGFVIAFWACPTMTLGHLVFAWVSLLYVLAALQLEERDLLRAIGPAYAAYRQRVPMLVPWRGAGRRS